MFNRKIEISKGNESILFINAVIENLRYGIISLDIMFSHEDNREYIHSYYDEHTFFFFHLQSLLMAQGNIHNVLFNNFFGKRKICQERANIVRDAFGLDLSKYPLIGNKDFRNSNTHFDERYFENNIVGDMNILDSSTPNNVRDEILNPQARHLRTIDIENWMYYSYNRAGKQIILDLKELRDQMYDMLTELCTCDIRTIENKINQ